MMTQLVEAGNGYASSASGYVLTVLTGATVLLMAWVVRTQLKIVLTQQRLSDAIFPPNKPNMPDQVEAIRDDLKTLKHTGSDRLKEILAEAKVIKDAVTPND